MLPTDCSIRLMTLRMSRKCISGPLKDTDCLPIGAGSYGLLQRGCGGEVNLCAEEVAEAKPKSTESEQRDARAGGEIGEEVDVGVGFSFATGRRTKEAQV